MVGHLSLGGAGGRRRHCGGGERDGRAAELHRPPRAREYAPGGWGGTAAARVGSSLGREQDEQGIRGQGRMRAPRLPAPGGGGSRAVTCGGSGGGGSRGGEGASFRKGWDLPARPLPPQRGPSPTYSGVPVAGLRVDSRALRSRLVPPPLPPPRPRFPHRHPGLRLRADGPIASFLSQGGRACLALLTQQKAGRDPGSSACWLFIPDLL